MQGAAGILSVIATLAIVALVLPNFTLTTAGPVYAPSQLLSSVGCRCFSMLSSSSCRLCGTGMISSSKMALQVTRAARNRSVLISSILFDR